MSPSFAGASGCRKEFRIKTDVATHSETGAVHTGAWSYTGRCRVGSQNRNSPAFLPADFQIVIHGLAGLIGELELDRAACLLLPHRCTVDRITSGATSLTLRATSIAAAQLAVDGQIEQGKVTGSPLDQQAGSNRPKMLWSQRRFRADQLALVLGRAAGRKAIFIVWHGRTPRLRGGRACSRPLAAGIIVSFQRGRGHRGGHWANGPVVNDPDVWSGRASQEDFVELAVSGLASMYPAFDWSALCSGPSWISARVRSH